MKFFNKYFIFYSLICFLISDGSVFAQALNLDSLIRTSENKDLPYKQRFKSYLKIYDSFENQEMYAKGKPYLDLALQLANNNADHEAFADANAYLGRYFLMADDIANAISFLSKALETYKTENKPDKASVVLKYFGLTYSQKKDFLKAIEYYDRSIEYSKDSDSKKEIFTCLYLKALALQELGDKKLEQSYEILKNIIEQVEPDSVITVQRKFECRVGIGDILLKKNLYDSAANYYNLAFNYFNKVKNYSGIAYAGEKLANVYLIQNKIDSALVIGILSYNIADSVKDNSIKLASSKVISDAYSRKNNFKEAYYFLKHYDSLTYLTNNSEIEKKFNNLQLTTLQKEKKIEEENTFKQKKLKNYFILGFALASIFLLISLISIRQNRKKNTALKKSNLEVQQTLNQLQDTQEQLIRQEKLASLGTMVAGIAHEMQNPLNFVNNFSESSVHLVKELTKANDEDRKQILQEIIINMSRIQEHGNRASGIVKSMLLYSRKESFDKQKADINNMLNDFIPLAYEGLHASDPGFSCRIEKNFAVLPLVLCSPQNLSRVFLNLLTNAFYAVNEKKKLSDSYYLPLVSITTIIIDGGIKIIIRDNGSGIPDYIKEKIFEPFFTTKPAGKGTGLGLSLSYDLIKAHGGMLYVESKVGIFTEFSITLPVT